MVHTHLKPANILAVDECLKLSSDSVRSAAESLIPGPTGAYDAPEHTPSTAGDVWSLGVVLVEALTQRVQRTAPSNLSEPFGTIASHCLQPNPADRWTVAQIESGLAPPVMDEKPKSRFGMPMGVRIALGLMVVLLVGVILKSKQTSETASQPAVESTRVPETPKAAAENTLPEREKPPTVAAKPEKKPEPDTPVTQTAQRAPQAAQQPPQQIPTQIGDQPMPEVLPQARNSIHGKVTVFYQGRRGCFRHRHECRDRST